MKAKRDFGITPQDNRGNYLSDDPVARPTLTAGTVAITSPNSGQTDSSTRRNN